MKYDYIIAGVGCAGLSLLYRMLKNPVLQKKKILLVDKALKTDNDRTWCFWEKDKGIFESIVRHQWKTLEFKTEKFTNEFELAEYKYKMIKGIDFYNFVLNYAKKFDAVEFKQEDILAFDVIDHKAVLKTSSGTYTSKYIFNSTSLLNPPLSKDNTLLQHFMGWEIEITQPLFNPDVGTLMDFSIEQKDGITFMYVLPISKNRALIEYTLFTSTVLDKNDYRKALEKYIHNKLSLKDYTIIEEEYGIIPMSLKRFTPHFKKNVINIGTAGGYTKSSSGYTFQFIQKHADKMMHQLVQGEHPLIEATFKEKRFQWYDRTLLEVIISKRMSGKNIFSRMFSKVNPEKILKFLDNESTFLEDLSIMYSLPTSKFLPAGIKQLLK